MSIQEPETSLRIADHLNQSTYMYTTYVDPLVVSGT